MRYRVILPTHISTGSKLHALYLLHGGGGSYRDWSNYSDIAHLAELGFALVMPQGDYSYYTNSATHAQDRYEDYIVEDLIADAEHRFPLERGRANRAIAGVSMGGFGAINLALRHPDLYAFAGGISPALDVPSRPFSIRRMGQWRDFRSIFGPWNGAHQHENDPLLLARTVDPATTPYLFVSCGDNEGLLASNRRFIGILKRRGFAHEFHVVPGGHDWLQFSHTVSLLSASLVKHFPFAIVKK